MIFLGELALYALEFIGAALVIAVAFVIAIYALVWGLALVCALIDWWRTK